MVQMNWFARQKQRHRCGEETCGHQKAVLIGPVPPSTCHFCPPLPAAPPPFRFSLTLIPRTVAFTLVVHMNCLCSFKMHSCPGQKTGFSLDSSWIYNNNKDTPKIFLTGSLSETRLNQKQEGFRRLQPIMSSFLPVGSNICPHIISQGEVHCL